MPSLEVDLGSLELRCRRSGWNADLHNSAKFAASGEDDLAQIENVLTHGAPNVYSDDSPWISRGQILRVELHVRILELLLADTELELINALTRQLRTAKLWEQLSLTLASVESSSPIRGVHNITVSLKTCQSRPAQPRRQLHKLGTDVPFSDVCPPLGVPVVVLESVCLEMILTNPSTPTESGLSADEDPVYDLSDGDEDIMLEATNISAHGPPIRETDPSDVNTQSDEMRPDRELPALLGLLDAAIRMSITPQPRRLDSTIVKIATKSLRHLSPLMPSIWSPEHLSGVTSRAIFIPTISHALQTVCGKTAISTRATAPLLWRLLGRGVYDSNAARRLYPIFMATQDSTVDVDTGDELLVTFQDSVPDNMGSDGMLYSLEESEYDCDLLDDMIDEEEEWFFHEATPLPHLSRDDDLEMLEQPQSWQSKLGVKPCWSPGTLEHFTIEEHLGI